MALCITDKGRAALYVAALQNAKLEREKQEREEKIQKEALKLVKEAFKEKLQSFTQPVK